MRGKLEKSLILNPNLKNQVGHRFDILPDGAISVVFEFEGNRVFFHMHPAEAQALGILFLESAAISNRLVIPQNLKAGVAVVPPPNGVPVPHPASAPATLPAPGEGDNGSPQS